MGISKKRDGRYVVGKGITDSNEYKGSAGWRDMVIQYTASGATEKSLEYLEYLRDYALYHSGNGEPIIPPNVSIWLSTEDTMKAVEADDISVSGETVSIGAVTWDGSDWTFGTPSSGGGGSSLPAYTSSDIGKVLTVGEQTETVIVVPEQTVTGTAPLVGVTVDPTDIPIGTQAVFYVKEGGHPQTYDCEYMYDSEEDMYCFNNSDFYDGAVVGYYQGNWRQYAIDGTCTVSLTASAPKIEPKWEAAGGGALFVRATGECEYTDGGLGGTTSWSVGVDKTKDEIYAAFSLANPRPVYFIVPQFTTTAPYYTYEQDADNSVMNLMIRLVDPLYTKYEASVRAWTIELSKAKGSGDFEIYVETTGEA